MGCPAKRVIGGYAGSALMRDLDHAARLIEATVEGGQRPRDREDAARLGSCRDQRAGTRPRAQALGVKAVTVHGRTRQQFYKGQADWNAMRAVVPAVGIPVVANGDIGSLEDARRCLSPRAQRGNDRPLGRGAALARRPDRRGACRADDSRSDA